MADDVHLYDPRSASTLPVTVLAFRTYRKVTGNIRPVDLLQEVNQFPPRQRISRSVSGQVLESGSDGPRDHPALRLASGRPLRLLPYQACLGQDLVVLSLCQRPLVNCTPRAPTKSAGYRPGPLP